MGRCSYLRKELDKENHKLVKKCCGKETWKGSDKFCIFHDPSPDKDVDLFKKTIEKQMQSEIGRYDFVGYCFPDEWDFCGKKFEDDADFREAIFQNVEFEGATFKDAKFSRATFKGDADFIQTTFQNVDFDKCFFQKAIFLGTVFQGTANFWGTTFQDAYFSEATFQDTNFKKATFRNADFEGATFYRKVELELENIEKLDLSYAEFFFRSHITADLARILFYRASIENVIFHGYTWDESTILYEEKHMGDEEIDLSYSQLEVIYRDLKQNIRNHGDYSTAGELYYREMEMRRKGTSKKKRLWPYIYKAIAGYGERPQNTGLVSASIIFLFAFLYGALDCLDYSIENPSLQQKIIDAIYFSFVTFTTLGLGDITPVTTPGKALICFEAVIGAFMIAVFVVVFVRKMAR